MVQREVGGYGTQSEIRFLNELGNGTYTQAPQVLECSRAELLRRYIKAMALRIVWGSINKTEISLHAQNLLAQYSRGGNHGALL